MATLPSPRPRHLLRRRVARVIYICGSFKSRAKASGNELIDQLRRRDVSRSSSDVSVAPGGGYFLRRGGHRRISGGRARRPESAPVAGTPSGPARSQPRPSRAERTRVPSQARNAGSMRYKQTIGARRQLEGFQFAAVTDNSPGQLTWWGSPLCIVGMNSA